ncbi:MAG: hypothetical protein V2I33_20010, partial [Kangiellaceae bacterium]|nr:hypothetical protein [Kangiellaceae bacterium]
MARTGAGLRRLLTSAALLYIAYVRHLQGLPVDLKTVDTRKRPAAVILEEQGELVHVLELRKAEFHNTRIEMLIGQLKSL